MADRSGSRKHKWSIPPEMSPSKYMRVHDTHCSRERDSDSPSPPRERQVTIYPCQSSSPKCALGLGPGVDSTERAGGGGHRRTTSVDYRGPERPEMSTPSKASGGDSKMGTDEDTKTRSEDSHRSRTRTLQASSMLFKRAFSDILGNSLRRSLDSQSPTEAEKAARLQQRGSRRSEPLPRTDTLQKKTEGEKLLRRSDSAIHPILINRTITTPSHRAEIEVSNKYSRKSELLLVEDRLVKETEKEKTSRRSDGSDHQTRLVRTITRPIHREGPEVHKGYSQISEPSLVEDRPTKESGEEKASRRSGGSDHQIKLGQTITRPVRREGPEVHKGYSQNSKPSLVEDRPTKESGEEKASRRSGGSDHQTRLARRITRPVRREGPEVHKEYSVNFEPLLGTDGPQKASQGSAGSASQGSEGLTGVRRFSRRVTREIPKERAEVRKDKSEACREKEKAGKRKPRARGLEEAKAGKDKPPASAITPRLLFINESDKESDMADHLEKNPSIGSDFSDVEDMGSLTKFSQEDARNLDSPAEDPKARTSTPGYVMYPLNLYGSPWTKSTDQWPTSPMYKPDAEQNKWRQDLLNKSCASEVSLNAESCLNTSSDSEGELDQSDGRWKQSGSFDTSWTSRRSLHVSPPADSSPPKFLREGFIDTHCHLDMLFARLQHKRSFADLRQQFASTFPREFQGCITDYCDPRTLRRLPWRHVLNENLVWGAFGCHPHFAQYYNDELQEEMMQALRHPKAIAYGEMGLDYSHKCSTTVPDQHAVFEKQLKLAVPLGKPLVIHCRDADEDLFRIMKKWVPWDYKIHRHCFTGNYKDIEPLLNEFPNMSVGFTAVLTYPSAHSAREAVSQIPLDRLIIETDAPFFVPRQVPKSLCKFSHPGLALHTAEEIARLKSLPVKSVMAKVRENTHRLYNI